MTDAERFDAKVDFNGPLWNGTPHWLWTASLFTQSGYGQFNIGSKAEGNKRPVSASRWNYERHVDILHYSMQVDHLCRVRRCVNPAHLEAVTPQVNVLRGESLAARRAKQTHCLRGHPLSGDNLYQWPGSGKGWRQCLTCKRDRARVSP